MEEMEAREVREVPLRRANKSVSLAAGLNRLQAGEGRARICLTPRDERAGPASSTQSVR